MSWATHYNVAVEKGLRARQVFRYLDYLYEKNTANYNLNWRALSEIDDVLFCLSILSCESAALEDEEPWPASWEHGDAFRCWIKVTLNKWIRKL